MTDPAPQLPVSPQEVQIEASTAFSGAPGKIGFFWNKLKIHKFQILVGVLAILVFGGAVFGAYKLGQKQVQPELAEKPTPTPMATATPTPEGVGVNCRTLETFEMEELAQISKVDCQNCDGRWELLSKDLDTTGCNPKTSDAGKACTNYDQCIGLCLAEDESSISGACSDYKYKLGCNLEFSEGEPVMLCRD